MIFPRLLPAALLAALACTSPAGGWVVVPLVTVSSKSISGRSTFCGVIDVADSTVYDTTQVTERPVLYEARDLQYPRSARARGAQGRVWLAVTVNADGSADAKSIQTISSPDSMLTRAATDWVLGAEFMPVCRAGKAVRVRVAMPVDFKP
jgi:TonB family protein